MNQQAMIFEVSEASFDKYIIGNSDKVPVLVEFMGVWSGPCIEMSDQLSALANEFAGRFIFAKADIDEQPGLRERFKIVNVPTLMVFTNGAEQRREEGQMQEPELRALLREFGVFRESDLLREQARELHLAGDTPAAIMRLAEAARNDPGNTRVAMDMVQIFIDIGELGQARTLFNRLPEADRNNDTGKALSGRLVFSELAAKTAGPQALTERLAQTPGDHDARFDLAVCQIATYQAREALDNLLIIQQQAPEYRDGAAREMIITVINMLNSTAPDLAQEYRRKLANLVSG